MLRAVSEQLYEWLERPQTGDNLHHETTLTRQTVQRETAATSDFIREERPFFQDLFIANDEPQSVTLS